MILKPRPFRKPNLAHPLARGLVGCWIFNEGGGNEVFDLSGNNLSGTFTSGLLWAPGAQGYCVQSDTDGEYISVADCSLLRSAHVTVACYVNITNVGPAIGDGIVSKNDAAGSEGWALRNCVGYLRWGINAYNSNIAQSDAGTITAGNWYFLVGTYDGVTCRVYIDGIEAASADDAGPISYGSDALNIGRMFQSDTYTSDQQISYVMIWDRALTGAEIALLYRQPFCMFRRAPIELWAAASPGIVGETVTPDALSTLLNLQSPDINYDFTILPDVLSALTVLQATDITLSAVISPDTGLLTIVLTIPETNYDFIITSEVFSALLTLQSAGINYDFKTTPGAFSISIAPQIPETHYDFTVSPNVLSALATLQTADIYIGITISPDTGLLSATLTIPETKYDFVVTPDVLSALLTLQAVGINYDFKVTPEALSALLTLQTIGVNFDFTVAPDICSLLLVPQTPEAHYDFVISPDAFALLLTLLTPEAKYDYVTAISTALSLISNLQSPEISTGVNITVSPDTGLLTVTCSVPTFTYDYLYEVAASLGIDCYLQAPTIPLGRTYMVYDKDNHYLSIFVEGTEVVRFKSDGNIDVNATVNENVF